MSYFGFLLRFLVIPIFVLLAVALWDGRRGRERDPLLRGVSIWAAIALHVIIALIYTTPWDNYLVAAGVWWYDPAKVAGLTLGWVPIEEYTFFVLQPILGGLWLAFLARRLPARPEPLRASLRLWLPPALGVVWLGSVALLVGGWDPGTYLGLQLAWALPPIMLQLAFGADILWHHRRLLALAIIPLTLYLSAADTLAITGGTWTIDPAQSLNIYLGGILPLEELLFFLFTNILVTFGIVLLWAEASRARVVAMIQWWRGQAWRAPGRSPNQPVGPLPERME